MSHVYISYARPDKDFAERLFDELKKSNVKVWLDIEGLVAGEDFNSIILDQIKNAKVVVVLLSQHSRRAGFVEYEFRSALEHNPNVIPVLLDSSATENWIWPLIADRQAIGYDPNTSRKELVEQVTQTVLSVSDRTQATPSALLQAGDTLVLLPKMAPAHWMGIIQFLAAFLLGVLATWLFML